MTGISDCDFFVGLLKWATADVNVLGGHYQCTLNYCVYYGRNLEMMSKPLFHSKEVKYDLIGEYK